MSLVALLLTQAPVQALDDAPVIDRPAMVIKAGEIAPFNGVLMSDALTIQTGKRLAYGDACVDFTEGKSVVSTPVLVASVAVVVAVVASVAAASFVAGRDSKH